VSFGTQASAGIKYGVPGILQASAGIKYGVPGILRNSPGILVVLLVMDIIPP